MGLQQGFFSLPLHPDQLSAHPTHYLLSISGSSFKKKAAGA
jgi:hypothetical protein